MVLLHALPHAVSVFTTRLVLFLTSLTGCRIGSKCSVADDVNRRPIRENST